MTVISTSNSFPPIIWPGLAAPVYFPFNSVCPLLVCLVFVRRLSRFRTVISSWCTRLIRLFPGIGNGQGVMTRYLPLSCAFWLPKLQPTISPSLSMVTTRSQGPEWVVEHSGNWLGLLAGYAGNMYQYIIAMPQSNFLHIYDTWTLLLGCCNEGAEVLGLGLAGSSRLSCTWVSRAGDRSKFEHLFQLGFNS